MRRHRIVLGLALVAGTWGSLAAGDGPAPRVVGGAAAVPKLGVNVTEQQLMSLPDGTIVETELGQRLTAAEARRLLLARKQTLAQRKRTIARNAHALAQSSPRPLPGPKPAGPPPGLNQNASQALAGRAVQPPPPPAGASAGDAQFSGCGMSATTQRYLSAINVTSGAVSFTPGGAYKLSGCGFGGKPGSVQLTGGSGGGWQSVSLVVQSWSNDTIIAKVDTNLSGVSDQANVILVVTDANNGVLQKSGNSFTAAQVVTPLTALPGLLVSGNKSAQVNIASPGTAGATFSVSYGYPSATQFCPADRPSDTILLSKANLKPGFVIDHVDVFNRVVAPQDVGDDEFRLLNGFSFGWNGSDFTITPQILQDYTKQNLFIGGNSYCSTVYDATVFVRGPKGMAAL